LYQSINKLLIKSTLIAALLPLSGGVSGSSLTINDLYNEIDKLKLEIDSIKKKEESQNKGRDNYATHEDLNGFRTDLENYKYEQNRQYETTIARTKRGTVLGGTVAARAAWQNPGTSNGANTPADDAKTSFNIPLVLLNLNGSLYRDYSEGRNLDYRVQWAYAQNSPANNGSQLNLLDAYLVYSFKPTLTGLEEDKSTLTFGQQQIPFGLEAQVGEELRPVINSAQFLSGLGVGARQIGLILRGDAYSYVDYGFNYRAPLIEYAIGVVNGNGPNKRDDNSDKHYVLRLASTLPVDYQSIFRELKVGVSLYEGEQNQMVREGLVDRVIGQGKARIQGFDIYYNHNPIGITYEQAKSEIETAAGDVESEGQYLTFYYTFGEQWIRSVRGQAKFDDWWPRSYQLFYRWDEFDPDSNLPDNRTTVNTAGINIFFAETTKFQFNIGENDYENPARRDEKFVIAQFQFGF
jgi:hypothetical protein